MQLLKEFMQTFCEIDGTAAFHVNRKHWKHLKRLLKQVWKVKL